MKPLILASKSPRRKELLTRAGIDFTVKTAEVEERFDPAASPGEIVMHLSEIKADAVYQKHPEAVVLGSDTVVVLDGKILGKPKDKPDAIRMLTLLSGRTHEVYTGVTILSGEKKEQFFECTRVTFFPLTEEEILEYVATGEPMDKAGAYGIQEKGVALVKGIEGDYFTVVGLPVARVIRALRPLNV